MCVCLNVKHSTEQSTSQECKFKDNWIRGHLMHTLLTQEFFREWSGVSAKL